MYRSIENIPVLCLGICRKRLPLSLLASRRMMFSILFSFVLLTNVDGQTPTTTLLGTNSNPACVNSSITFTATIDAPGATGTVSFLNDGVSMGSPVTVTGATATFSTTALTAGNHTISAIYSGDASFTTSTGTLVQNIAASPIASISYASPFCKMGLLQQPVTLTGTGSYTGGTYTSNPAGLMLDASTGAIRPGSSQPNTYTVNYTTPATAFCPAFVATTTVQITALPTASISYASPFCKSISTSQGVTLTGSNDYTGGTYSASSPDLSIDPSTGNIIPSTSKAGTYLVTYSIPAAGGCSAVSATSSVTITEAPTASISYAQPFCNNVGGGQSANLTGTGAYTGGTFSAIPAGLSLNSSNGAINPSTSNAGTYTVTYTFGGSSGCVGNIATASVTITALPTATITYAGPFCKSLGLVQAVTLTGTNAYTGGTYTSLPAGLSIDATTGSILPSSSNPGTYTITYSLLATGGCSGISTSTVVKITEVPSAALTYAGPYCKSITTPQDPSLSGTGAYATGTFSSSPAGLSIDPITGKVTPSSSNAGTYTILYTIPASGGCVATSASATLTITSTSATISYMGPFCQTISTSQDVNLTGTGAYTGGTFSASPAGLSINSGTGSIIPSLSVAGTYLVTYTMPASGGCAAGPVTTTVNITAVPTAVMHYATPFCKTSILPQGPGLTGTGAYTGGTYSSTTGLTINASSGLITPTSSTAGTYTVTYAIPASGGCAASSITATVSITTAPTATISYSGMPYCTSQAGTQLVTRTGTAGGTFSSTAGLAINSSTGTITPSASNGGNYVVTYNIPASGGCGAVNATASVSITAMPVASFSYAGSPYCRFGTNPSPTFSAGGSAGVFSSTPAGLNFVSANTGQINLSTSAAGTYTVTNTIPAANGCGQVIATNTVTISTAATASFSYPGTPYCSGESNPAPVFSGGGIAGTFSSTAGLVFTNVTTGQVNLAASTPGIYTVTNTIPAGSGCGPVAATSTIEVKSGPTVSILANYCIGGGKVRLMAVPSIAGTYTYSWTNSATTSIIDIDIAGSYAVTITDVNGCKATSSIVISQELAVNGDFSLGNVGFTSAYANNQSANGLQPEGLYAVGANANFHHDNFWGYDHTSGGAGTGKFMIINGYDSTGGKIIWQEGPVTIQPNTTYYFSAWAMSLNNWSPFANLQFKVNTGMGNMAIGTTAALGPGAMNNSNNGWVRFYGVWNSGLATSATLSIVDLQTATNGNDFGLDDISISTLAPVAFTTAPSASACIGSLLTLHANRTGGTSPFTYSWTGPNGFTSTQSDPLVSNNASAALHNGVYSVTITDFYGCPITGSVNVSVNPRLTVTNRTATACSGTAFSVTPTGLPANTTYTWTAPTGTGFTGGADQSTQQTSISGTLTNTTNVAVTATYTVTPIVDGGCPGNPFTLTVTVNPKANLIDQATNACSGTAFTYTPTGAPAGTTYTWIAPTGTGFTGGTSQIFPQSSLTQTLTNTTTGPVTAVYVVTPRIGTCLQTPFKLTVTLNSRPTVTNQTAVICSGSTFAVNPAGAPAGITYAWSAPAISPAGAIVGGSSQSGQSSISQTLINNTTAAATATYIVTPSAGICSGATFTVVVTVNPKPAVANQTATICSNNAFTITPSGVPTGTTYTWSAPVISPVGSITGGNAQLAGQTSISQVLTNTTNDLATATYTVIPSKAGCNGDPFTITVTVNPIITISNQSLTVCSGNGFSYVPTGAMTGTTYTWAAPTGTGFSGGSGTLLAQPAINQTLTNNTNAVVTAVYTLVPRIGNCLGNPFTLTVTLNPKPIVSNQIATICSGSSFNINPASVPAGTTYTWSTPTINPAGAIAGATDQLLAQTNISQVLTNTTLNTATVTYTVTPSAAGCPGNPFTVVVTVNPKPVVNDQVATICSGSGFLITPTGVPVGTSYTWSTPVINPAGSISGSTSQLTGQTSIGQTLTNNSGNVATATYTVTPTTGSCAGNTFTIIVTVNPKPAAPIVALTQPTCAVTTGVAIVTNPVGAGFEYSIDGGSFQSSSSFNGVNPGTHSIIVRTAAGCVSLPTSFVISNVPTPPATATATVTTQPTCGTGSGTITISSPLGANYEYSIDGATYQLSNIFNGILPGTHNIRVRSTTDNSCISLPYSISVNAQPLPPAPPVVVVTQQPTCAITSGAIKINTPLGLGYEYSLDGGAFQSGTTFSGLTPGNHLIVVRTLSDLSCISSPASVVINGIPVPPVSPIASVTVQPTCAVPTGVIVVSSPLATGLEYSLDGGPWQTSTSFSGVIPGMHNVKVRNSTETTCVSNATSITVDQIPPPMVVTQTHVNVLCNGGTTGSIDLSVSAGTSPYTYAWSNGSGSQDLTALSAGVYTVTITDAGGCTATTTIPISQPAKLTVSENHINPSCLAPAGGSIDLTVSGGVGPYTYSWSGGQLSQDIAGLVAGNYSVLIQDANGCSITKDITISEPPVIVVTETHSNINCAGGVSTVTISATGGNGIYSGTGVFTQPAGTKIYTVNDANGCTANVSVTVSAPSPLVVSESHTSILCSGGSSTVTISASGGVGAYTGTGVFIQAAGTKLYTVTDNNGCSSSISVVVSEPQPLSIHETHTTIACNGGISTIDISATGGTAPYSGTGQFNQSSGTVSYTVTDANGCSASVSVQVTQPNSLSVTESHTAILCNGGESIVTIEANGGTAPLSGTGIFQQAAGTTIYTVRDANGCTQAISVTVAEPATLTVSEVHTPVLCSGGASAVTITGNGGTAPYNGIGIFNQQNGTTFYTINDANGCIATIPVTIIEPNPIVLSETHTSIRCYGGEAEVTISAIGGAGSYTGTGSFMQHAGTKAYIVTDASGCSQTILVTVSEPQLLTASFTQTNISCNGSATGSVTITPTGGSGTYTINRPTIGLAAGDYNFIVEDGNGCRAELDVTITEAPAATATIHGDATICDGNATDITVDLTGTGPWSVTYTDGTTPVTVNNILTSPYVFSVNPAANSAYTLVSVSADGCPSIINGSASVSVTQHAIPVFNQIDPVCQGAVPQDLPTTSLNGIEGFWNPAAINTTTPGTTTYTFITTSQPCTESVSMDITVLPTPKTKTLVTVCSNQMPYSWNGNSYTTAGSYDVVLTAASGCDSIATLKLDVVAAVTPVFDPIGPYCEGEIPDPLPLQSVNSVLGTWNPSVINTSIAGTTTYRFTPSGGGCRVPITHGYRGNRKENTCLPTNRINLSK